MDDEKKCKIGYPEIATIVLLTDDVKELIGAQAIKTNIAILQNNHLHIDENIKLTDQQFNSMKALK